MTEKPTTYGKMTQILHWVAALLIFMALTFGTVMTKFAPEDMVDKFYNNHVAGGWVLLALMVMRLFARLAEPAPDAPEGLSGTRAKLFTWNHVLLYVFIFIMVGSGVGILSMSGLSIFPGSLTANGIQKVFTISLHDLVSKIVLLLIVMHIGGVLMHQFTESDVLSRMGLKLKK